MGRGVIVIDVGCADRAGDESVHRLIDRFRPGLLLGFDPALEMDEGVETVAGTVVVRKRAAAWTSAGVLTIETSGIDGIRTGVQLPDAPQNGGAVFAADCFDLAALLWTLPRAQTVLKVDAEGAEYPLLAMVNEARLDADLALVLVEWHPPEKAHGLYAERPALRCPVEEW